MTLRLCVNCKYYKQYYKRQLCTSPRIVIKLSIDPVTGNITENTTCNNVEFQRMKLTWFQRLNRLNIDHICGYGGEFWEELQDS